MSWSRVFVNFVFLSLGAALTWFFFLRLSGPQVAPSERTTVLESPGSTKVSPAGGLQGAFEEWSADPSLAGASIGFCLLNDSGGIEFASPLAWNAMCPASALKTVTTAAALELLGPDFRFETGLSATASISRDGVLAGDLLLRGHYDPTLSTSDLEVLADEFVQAGLKQVNGTVSASRQNSDSLPVSEHWNWGDIGNAYGAGAYRLNVDHNRILIRFSPGEKVGDPAAISETPPTTSDTKWINQVVTGEESSGDRVTVYSEPFGRRITLVGSVPMKESGFAVNAALPDPPKRAEEIILARLKKSGVRVLNREIEEYKSSHTFDATHESAPLPEIIDHLHKVSDNLEAQCLFLTLGGQDPVAKLRQHWESRGVEFKGLRLIDGSGLARANMIRPLDLAKVNHLARRGPHGERFRQSLTAYLDGSVRSKLGAMSGVKTDVGFITMADGREFTFCLMANGLNPELNFWPLRDKLLLQVASGSGR